METFIGHVAELDTMISVESFIICFLMLLRRTRMNTRNDNLLRHGAARVARKNLGARP
jgi:hypothetical protein